MEKAAMKTTIFTPIQPGASYTVSENDVDVGTVYRRGGVWCTRLDEDESAVGCADTRMESVTRAHVLVARRKTYESRRK